MNTQLGFDCNESAFNMQEPLHPQSMRQILPYEALYMLKRFESLIKKKSLLIGMVPLTHSCSLNSILHLSIQLKTLSFLLIFQYVNGILMDSMWNDYDKLSVQLLTYLIEVGQTFQNMNSCFMLAKQWASKHCLACHEFSSPLLQSPIPPSMSHFEYGPLTQTLESLEIGEAFSNLSSLTKASSYLTYIKLPKIASFSSQLEVCDKLT